MFLMGRPFHIIPPLNLIENLPGQSHSIVGSKTKDTVGKEAIVDNETTDYSVGESSEKENNKVVYCHF